MNNNISDDLREFKTISVYLHRDNISALDDFAKDNRIVSRSSALNILLSQIFNNELKK